MFVCCLVGWVACDRMGGLDWLGWLDLSFGGL